MFTDNDDVYGKDDSSTLIILRTMRIIFGVGVVNLKQSGIMWGLAL